MSVALSGLDRIFAALFRVLSDLRVIFQPETISSDSLPRRRPSLRVCPATLLTPLERAFACRRHQNEIGVVLLVNLKKCTTLRDQYEQNGGRFRASNISTGQREMMLVPAPSFHHQRPVIHRCIALLILDGFFVMLLRRSGGPQHNYVHTYLQYYIQYCTYHLCTVHTISIILK